MEDGENKVKDLMKRLQLQRGAMKDPVMELANQLCADLSNSQLDPHQLYCALFLAARAMASVVDHALGKEVGDEARVRGLNDAGEYQIGAALRDYSGPTQFDAKDAQVIPFKKREP